MTTKQNPRRAELKAISKALRPLVKAGKYPNTNAAILAYYGSKTGQTDFRTFNTWRKAGFVVRKGESGYPIWAQPRRMSPQEGARMSDLAVVAAMQGAAPQGPEWFPVCYLFHAGQVEAVNATAERIAA